MKGHWIDDNREYYNEVTRVHFLVISYFNSEYFRMDFPLKENEELPFKRIEMSLASQPYDHTVDKSLFELEYRYQKDQDEDQFDSVTFENGQTLFKVYAETPFVQDQIWTTANSDQKQVFYVDPADANTEYRWLDGYTSDYLE